MSLVKGLDKLGLPQNPLSGSQPTFKSWLRSAPFGAVTLDFSLVPPLYCPKH